VVGERCRGADPLPGDLLGLRELRPSLPVTELAEVGHYLQIEQPRRIAELVIAASQALR